MIETIKYLWKEANAKRNRKNTNIKWYICECTSGTEYLWTIENHVRCYIHISRNGEFSRPTFSLITKKYPFGTEEIGYGEALRLAGNS